MGKVHWARASILAVVLVSGPAHAQRAGRGAVHGQPGSGDPAQAPKLVRSQLASDGIVEAARARQRNGDCEGALDAFDEALRTSTDATLYRDRGLCHEKLGQPYPAIDDYRRYLTETPGADDADAIRGRLSLLEDQTSGRAHVTAEDDDSPFEKPKPKPAPESDKPADKPPLVPTGVTSTRGIPIDETDDDEMRSPLRRGRGFSVAPFFSEHKWLQTGASQGETWAEAVGIQVRYAFAVRSAILIEAGYELFNSTSVDPVGVSGLTSQLAYELRFPLDEAFNNQILVVPGLGYEHIVFSPNDPNLASSSAGGVLGRLRVGWRHMVGPSTAIDLALDGGFGEFFVYDGSSGFAASGSTTVGLAAATAALAWGL